MTEFVLKNEYIPLLGILWPGMRTPLSPLLPCGDRQEQDRIKTVLNPTGLLDSNGAIRAVYHPALEVISSPSWKIIVDIMRPDHFHAVTGYGARDPKKTFTHVMDETGTGRGYDIFTMQDIISLGGLEENVPGAEAFPLDTALSSSEAWVLAAIFDHERISALAAIAESSTPNDVSLIPAICTPSAAGNMLSEFTQKPENFLFLGLLNRLEGREGIFGIEQLGKDLKSLEEKELIRKSGNGYEIMEHLVPMARRSIFVDMAVTVRIDRADNGGPVLSESGFCIRADGTLLWFIRPLKSPEQIILKYLPSDRFIEILHHLFEDRSYSLSGIKVVNSEKKIKTRFCSQCGSELHAEAIFCNQCGYKFV
jgi:hypothetical protein